MIKNVLIFFLTLTPFIINAQNLSVSFTKTEKECLLAEATVSVITAAQPVNYLWSNGAITNSINELNPGDYYVTITDNNGKDTTINFTIETLICKPIPENNFTPNGDGFNDTWTISRIQHFPNFELFVYNRWGQQVHQQSNTFIPWDGFSLVFPLPDATYYYILFLDKSNKKDFIKGDVSIIR